MSKRNIITPVLAAGSTASPYNYQINVQRTLCQRACSAQTPLYQPTISLLGFSQAGAGTYRAKLRIDGLVSYKPCGAGDCCTRNELISESFVIPFDSTTTPTSVSVTTGTAVTRIVPEGCDTCSRNMVSDVPMILTIA